MMADPHELQLKIISYNMHGFNQGRVVVEDLIRQHIPDVFLLQEHWLTPDNLCKFDVYFPDYFSFGVSAMAKSVESGLLRGRPFGGVITLISNDLRNLAETIHCDDRYTVVRIANYLVINVYLPCVGTTDRLLVCKDLLADISSWRERFNYCECLVARDFNVDLDNQDVVADLVSAFAENYSLTRYDDVFPAANIATYVNSALNHCSHIDFILASCVPDVTNHVVLDPDNNFSDHLPLLTSVKYSVSSSHNRGQGGLSGKGPKINQFQLRWDHADVCSYYEFTRQNLEPVLAEVVNLSTTSCYSNTDTICETTDFIYNAVAHVLNTAAKLYVPECRKNSLKFWWDQELDILKDASIESNAVWKAAGRPRYGPIFDKRQRCRLQYRNRIRESEKLVTESYSNDLHEALLRKKW